jgi:glycosyltransferase involved in cell wall biosynthesis
MAGGQWYEPEKNEPMNEGDHSVPTGGEKRVAILLAIFNGAEFLQSQLETLARQTVTNLDIWASDDGSNDGSVSILECAERVWAKGSFHILEGPQMGFAENFRALLTNSEIEADYFAFCDQDDLWEEDKVADALEWLAAQDDQVPALYCSRTRSITVDGKKAGLSPLFPRMPGFRNAIVQSIAGGNTMVMNNAARKVIMEASRRTPFISHDWWCYLMVTGVGGVVHYSPIPKIGYRQHPRNLVGENNSWRARMSRLNYLMKGRFTGWNEANLNGLAACEDMLTAQALETVRLFAQARSKGLLARLSALVRSGVYRQTFFGQLGLYVACVLKRL